MNPEFTEELLGSLECPDYLLPNNVRVEKPTEAVGGDTTTKIIDWEPTDRTDVACSIQEAQGVVAYPTDQQEIQVTHTIYFAEDPGLEPGYRIIDNEDDETYIVPKHYEPAKIGAFWVAQVTKVERGHDGEQED